MKLISCEIENFGILHRERRVFGDGLNVICAPNGSGKSTLVVFIKAMLYGLPSSTKRSVTENERKHYQPWQGGAYGGTLTIEVGDKRYRIERYFGVRETEDTFTLIDLSTNRESKAYSSDIGYELFGIGADAYERSTYIGQRPIPAKGENTDLQARLSNLLEESGDLTSFGEAIERLERRRRFYQLSGNRGAIADLEAEKIRVEHAIRACRDRLTLAGENEERLVGEEKTLSEYEVNRKRLSEKVTELSRAGEIRALKEQYETLRKGLSECEAEAQTLSVFFGDRIPSEENIAQMKEAERRLLVLREQLRAPMSDGADRERLEALRPRFAAGAVLSDEEAIAAAETRERLSREVETDDVRMEYLDRLESQRSEQLAREKRRLPAVITLFVLAGLLLVAGGILLGTGVPMIAFGMWGGTLVSAVIAVILARGHGHSDVIPENDSQENVPAFREALSRKKQELTDLQRKLDTLLGEIPEGLTYVSAVHLYVAEHREYVALESRITTADETKKNMEEEADGITDRLCGILSAWYDPEPENLQELIGELEQKREKLLHANRMLLENRERMERFREEHGNPEDLREDPLTPDHETLEALRAELKELERATETQHARVAYLKEQCRQLSGAAEDLSDLESEAVALTEQIEEYRRNLAAIQDAEIYLTKAKESLSSRYLDRMQDGFRKYYGILTAHDSGSLEMNTSFEVKIRAEGKQYDAEYLSRGLRDAVNLCTRFALADALFEGEQPFLILDDPLVNLDDEKCEAAKKLLAERAEKCQILYLVCSQSRI